MEILKRKVRDKSELIQIQTYKPVGKVEEAVLYLLSNTSGTLDSNLRAGWTA